MLCVTYVGDSDADVQLGLVPPGQANVKRGMEEQIVTRYVCLLPRRVIRRRRLHTRLQDTSGK